MNRKVAHDVPADSTVGKFPRQSAVEGLHHAHTRAIGSVSVTGSDVNNCRVGRGKSNGTDSERWEIVGVGFPIRTTVVRSPQAACWRTCKDDGWIRWVKGQCVHASDTADVVPCGDVVQGRTTDLPIPLKRAAFRSPLFNLAVRIHCLLACQGVALVVRAAIHQMQPPFDLLVARTFYAFSAFPVRLKQGTNIIRRSILLLHQHRPIRILCRTGLCRRKQWKAAKQGSD